MKSSVRLSLVLAGVLVFLSVATGCLRYIRYDALPEENLDVEVRTFLNDVELAYELQNRYMLRTMLDERFAGSRWGRDQLIERMNKVFNQYSDVTLSLGDVRTRPMPRSLIARFNWTLTWTCDAIDPSRGCGDYDGNDRPDTVRRSGRTIFTLVYKNGDWFLKNQEGDLLIGLYAPGYRETGK